MNRDKNHFINCFVLAACEPGYYLNGTSCQQCKEGEYQDVVNPTDICKKCEAARPRSTHEVMGQTNYTDCCKFLFLKGLWLIF